MKFSCFRFHHITPAQAPAPGGFHALKKKKRAKRVFSDLILKTIFPFQKSDGNESHFNKHVNIGFVRIIFTASCFIYIGSLSKSHSLHISQLNESAYGFTERRWQIIIS